jgi:hypothetical protein
MKGRTSRRRWGWRSRAAAPAPRRGRGAAAEGAGGENLPAGAAVILLQDMRGLFVRVKQGEDVVWQQKMKPGSFHLQLPHADLAGVECECAANTHLVTRSRSCCSVSFKWPSPTCPRVLLYNILVYLVEHLQDVQPATLRLVAREGRHRPNARLPRATPALARPRRSRPG